MKRMICVDCRHFEPYGRIDPDAPLDPYAEGECRRQCPALGPMITDRHGDEFRHFGEWPKVLACDWCGEYTPCEPDRLAPPQPGDRADNDSVSSHIDSGEFGT
ncbi:MAG: hypothetical protein GC162_00700 [Planctomycetes bacterium]|nr:hypothetical protein [Planctomycetota bacterium]